MAINTRKRQKQLVRKKSKRNAKRVAARHSGGGTAALVRAAARGPIEHCLIPQELFDVGIGSIFLSRRSSDGTLISGVFLVDVFCLGVKDAFVTDLPEQELQQRMAMQPETFVESRPECARKLLHGAVAYARELGLPPHPAYARFEKLFGDVDPAACDEVFEFGRHGKPLYVPGPNDGARMAQRITRVLEHHD